MAPTGGPRSRYREQTRAEIKAIALRQLAEGGIAAVALTRIAKELGLSGPALYRYFANRDDLLTALIRDAYDDAAAAIADAEPRAAGEPARERLHRLSAAYRTWAATHPHRYLLIAGSPQPGYTAPADTVDRARSALGHFLPLFAGAEPVPAVLPVARRLTAWAEQEPAVAEWVAAAVAGTSGEAPRADTGASAATGICLAGALMSWTRTHGVVSLEVAGHFAGMGHDPAGLLAAEIDTLADAFRLD
ncbi:TetR/AcrR family transcriptional regulator [Marinitenerispora sediminis]|uniref:TetR/AcrR family transcriptional regulator n=1 Tax=Marinitenerispora sediminis TaxID=1931232 RepID=UPI000DF203F4|nr:TetR/AcrR family transcriptional regulator [Marinitenerispora sediminis]RCV51260.1 TetR/AcrR family transcriptional regulator [Marinitenerispora sediminis]RCV55510.1 TetR/AcrR family transcriptional regulator [Marinitenerispora sediminis]